MNSTAPVLFAIVMQPFFFVDEPYALCYCFLRMPAPILRLSLFGGFRLERAGREILLPRRKLQALLVYLVLHPEPHAREKLAALFWGDTPDVSARASLRNEISALRKILGKDHVLSDRETIQWNSSARVWTDAQEIYALRLTLTDLQNPDPTIPLESRIKYYKGDLLPAWYDDWILALREEYRQHYLSVLLQLVTYHRVRGEYAQAIQYTQKVLATDRANEQAYQHAMVCYAALGDRSAALQQYEECARALLEELGVVPSSETTALYESLRQKSETVSLAAHLTNLPNPLTSFVGRAQQIEQLKQIVASESGTRLLSLIGAGGSGKTRLAIQLGLELVERYTDGVWWVDLSALRDETLVAHQVAQVMGIREEPDQDLTSTLVKQLGVRQLVLIFDNCEHLLGGCARLVQVLMSHCPNVQILATSREPLQISGELIWTVPTLSIPTEIVVASLSDILLSFEAIRLFVDRARAASHNFSYSDRNALTVALICQRLDGIPLAIELAAARVRTMALDQIAARLDDRFNLLTGGKRTALPRQQTLRALIDWSYDLLTEEERVLFRQLSVFAGGWTVEAMEYVCGHSIPPSLLLNTLSRLVDKSLVVFEEHDGEGRYQFLETIREYASAKLVQSARFPKGNNEGLSNGDDAERFAQRHAEFMVGWLDQNDPRFFGSVPKQVLNKIIPEVDNLRAALAYAFQADDVERALVLVGRIARYWVRQGLLTEASTVLRRARETFGERGSPLARAHAAYGEGVIAWDSGAYEHAAAAYRDALALYHQANEELGEAYALHGIGRTLYEMGDYLQAQNHFRQTFQRALDLDEPSLVALSQMGIGLTLWSLNDLDTAYSVMQEASQRVKEARARGALLAVLLNFGALQNARGEYAAALATLDRAWQLAVEMSEIRLQLTILLELALARHQMGQRDEARADLRRLISRSRDLHSPNRLPIAFERLAELEYERGALVPMIELLSGAQHLREKMKQGRGASYQSDFKRLVDVARAAVGEAQFDTEWEKGQTLSEAQMVALALGE